MDLGESGWSMVKREASSSPGSPAEPSYLQPGDSRRSGGAHSPDELRTPPGDLDVLQGARTLHPYAHFGAHGNPLQSSGGEDVPLFTDLDQGGKLVLSGGSHKAAAAGLLVDPSDMYQSLAIAAAQSQAGYESSSGGAYMHSNPNSPVYVTSSRVGSMIPSLSYLQGGSSAQPGHAHAVSGHSVWSQPAPESPSYGAGSPHAASGRFHYPPSPPASNGTSRDVGYGNTLNAANRAEQYGLPRPLGGAYPPAYSPYVTPPLPQLPQLPSPWTGGPFDNGVLHTLQSRAAPLIRGPSGGKLGKRRRVRTIAKCPFIAYERRHLR